MSPRLTGYMRAAVIGVAVSCLDLDYWRAALFGVGILVAFWLTDELAEHRVETLRKKVNDALRETVRQARGGRI